MAWKKVPDAAQAWAGGVNPKTLYTAIRDKKLKAARIGAGRNLLLCEEWVDEWLRETAARSYSPSPAAARTPTQPRVRLRPAG